MKPKIENNKKEQFYKYILPQALLNLAWIQAFVATFGSLYFSEILKFPPCVLCWYQRIFMYPLVIIIAVGILLKDKHVSWYILPLSISGMLVALYQTLLNWGVIPYDPASCAQGISCITTYFNWFGFINIPFLSFLAFSVITVCAFAYHKIKSIHF